MNQLSRRTAGDIGSFLLNPIWGGAWIDNLDVAGQPTGCIALVISAGLTIDNFNLRTGANLYRPLFRKKTSPSRATAEVVEVSRSMRARRAFITNGWLFTRFYRRNQEESQKSSPPFSRR